MKFSLTILSVLAVVGLTSAASIPVLADYQKLLALCNAGGDDVYVGVHYGQNTYKTFKYNECYPYRFEGELAKMAVFCKSATCFNNPNPDCTGGAVPPVPVPIKSDLTLINAGDWVELLGQGATCQPNSIP